MIWPLKRSIAWIVQDVARIIHQGSKRPILKESVST
jgi:hypothetical protein